MNIRRKIAAATMIAACVTAGTVAALPTPAGAATGNGCTATALTPSNNYSSGLSYQMWAHATSSCAYRVSYTLELWRDVTLLPDVKLATNTGTTTYINTTYNGLRVNCGSYITPRGGKYYSKLKISWNGHSLTSQSSSIPAC